MENSAENIVRLFREAETRRKPWQHQWDELSRLVSPVRSTEAGLTPGLSRKIKSYDNSAQEAAKQLAATLHGILTSPALKWFALRPMLPAEDRESMEWIQAAEETLLSVFRSPSAGFYSTMHESYQDLVSFGTSAIFTSDQSGLLRYQSIPLGEIYITQNNQNRVDTVFRLFEFTAKQAAMEWGESSLSNQVRKDLNEKDGHAKKHRYIHAVMPREDRDASLIDSKNKPIASIYIDLDEVFTVDEGGFNEMPYAVSRWSRASGETYGRSPAMSILDEIKMANAVKKAMIQAKEKAASPPLWVTDDAVIGPMRTHPNGINYIRPGMSDAIGQMPTGDARVGDDILNEARAFIQSGFFLDKLNLPLQDRMTATEVIERRRDALQVMAPFIAREEEEKLSPIIGRTLSILIRRRAIAPPPEQLSRSGLEVQYISPLAISQRAGEIQAVQAWLGLLSPLAQIDPGVLAAVNTDELAQGTGINLNVPQRYINPPEVVQAQREKDQQQQQLAQAAQTGGQIADAAKTAVEVQQLLPT